MANPDGTRLSSWPDSSPAANPAIATLTARPTWNSLPGLGLGKVTFDGIANRLQSTLNATLTTHTVFVAGVLVDPPGGMLFCHAQDVGAGPGANLIAGKPFTIDVSRVAGIFDNQDVANSNELVDGAAHVLTWQYGGTHATNLLYQDGAIPPMDVVAAPDVGSGALAGKLTLGVGPIGAGFDTRWLPADLYEVLVFTPQLSPTNQVGVEGYLKDRWGTP